MAFIRKRRAVPLVCLSLALLQAGCGLVPTDGPSAEALRAQPDVVLAKPERQVSYALVNLSPLVLAAANSGASPSNTIAKIGPGRGKRDGRIAVGDLIGLTIFEAQAGGLFIPSDAGSRSGNFVTVPNQQIDVHGTINVPYAGAVDVVGRTAGQVADEIASKLKNRAIEPQVVVTIAERRGNEVSVLGDVTTATRFAMDPGGISLLGAIARAGGPKDPPYETVVSIERGGRSGHVAMSAIVNNPKLDVQLAGGDVVFVSREPKVFIALGATPSPGSVGGINNRRFVFDSDNMSLTEAVAKAGGLAPDRADPTAVFVFRLVPRETLAQMGVDTSIYRQAVVPTIFQANWGQTDAFFLSNSFFMQDKDVIFVSEHPTTDILKFSQVVRGFTAPASDAGFAASGFK